MDIRRIVLLIVLTIAIILLKLQFEYYNLSFPLLLLSVISFQLVKRKNPKRDKIILALLVVLNLLCLFTPDKFVYRILNSKEYFWSESDLQLSDFKGKPDSLSNITAIVFPKIIGKVNKVYNYPPAIVFTSNDSHKSWIKDLLFHGADDHQNKLRRLLDHEKHHLNLTEVYTRKAQDSLNNSLTLSPGEKYMVIKEYFNLADSIQDVFDLETEHGVDSTASKRWHSWIKSKLE